MTKGPKLQWKPMDSFPGEYEANVGDIQFSVATEGQWDICARGPGGHKLIIIDSGDSKNLASAKRKCQQWLDRLPKRWIRSFAGSTAKRKCQQWLDRQWRAMNKLKEKQQ